MRNRIVRRRGLRLAVLGTLITCLGACAPYQMQGVVHEGAVSTIRVVDKDDPRLLEGYAVPLASVDATLDADRISRKPLPREVSDVDGTFSMAVDETGAGYLDYYIRMVVRRQGYNSAVKDLRIPGPNQRVLVTLAPGEDRYKPEPADVLQETLEMSEPYMQ